MPGSAPDAEIPSGEPDVQPSTGFDPAYSGETGIGQSISQIAHLAFRQERYADQSAVIDANNRFADAATNALEDPKSGLLNQSAGKDAPKLADQTMSDLQNKRLEIMNGLGNDRQKVLFDRYSDEHRRMAQRRAFAWEKQQTDAYEQSNLEAAIANHQRNAVALADPSVPVDPVTGQDHIAQMEHQVDWQKSQIADYGNAKAWPQSQIEMKQNEAASKSYIGVIDSLVTGGHTDLAQQIYDKHGDEIDANKRAHVLDAIRSTRNDQAAEKQFATLMQRDKDNQFPDQATFQKRLDDAGLDPVLNDKVQKLGNVHFTAKEEAQKAQQMQLMSAAFDSIQKDPTVDPRQVVGAVQWQTLSEPTKEALYYLKDRFAKRDDLPNGQPAYYEAMDRLETDPTGAAKLSADDLALLATQMSNADYGRFRDKRAEKLSSYGKADYKQQTPEGVLKQSADETLELAGLDPEIARGDKYDPDKAANNARFRKMLGDAVIATERTSGKPVPKDQVDEMAKQLIISKRWTGGVDADPKNMQYALSASQVPDDQRQKITSVLLKRGLVRSDGTVDPEMIVKYYNDRTAGAAPKTTPTPAQRRKTMSDQMSSQLLLDAATNPNPTGF